MAYTYRELTPDEWCKVPAEAPGREVYTPENSRILAAFDGDEVVATWVVVPLVHLEPLYIAPAHRKSPTILRRLAENMKRMLIHYGVGQVYTVALNKTPELQRFALWFGAEQIPGKLYTWINTSSAAGTPSPAKE